MSSRLKIIVEAEIIKNFELEAKYYEAMDEIVKLRAKHKARIEELKKRRTDIIAENARLDAENFARVAKSEQDSRQPQNDFLFEKPTNLPDFVLDRAV
ncbi:hypothetical protein RhiirC2_855827 [Rhizophagus irregularis]|uniref:Uncharacterized protein n=1 Tax=Rhizophagus irregularis TaxID=588596 RepID=A0A2N1MKQ8_9GLOM|nr:hypothetical protein RhiirC2_855827 [Rhizophagus irregularis]